MSEPDRASSDAELIRIDGIVRSSRRTMRTAWVFSGAALCAALFFAAVTLAVLLDLTAPLTVPFRVAVFIGIVALTTTTLLIGVASPATRRLSATHMARRIERLIPQIQSRLV